MTCGECKYFEDRSGWVSVTMFGNIKCASKCCLEPTPITTQHGRPACRHFAGIRAHMAEREADVVELREGATPISSGRLVAIADDIPACDNCTQWKTTGRTPICRAGNTSAAYKWRHCGDWERKA